MFLRSLKVPVLLTGGAGVMGSHIADSLLVRGHEVAVVDSLSTGKRENVSTQGRFSEIDIRSGWEEDFEDFEPEALSHQAAQMDVMRSVREPHFDAEVNVLGTSGLLQNCVEHGLGKVVFASTGGAVYAEQREFLPTEDHPQYLLSCYEFSKLAAERFRYYLSRGTRHLIRCPALLKRLRS
jgi:UDP-glucose 4-epimerase